MNINGMVGKNHCVEYIKNTVDSFIEDINKPSQYIGQEIGSLNKNWETSTVKTAIAFPDMYEIGSCNLGHRILYHLVNNYKEKNFLADRVYAPAPDFKEKLKEYNVPLYAVESFRSIKDFDVLAFSLQYELSYPTILAMLEMGDIPIKSKDRNDDDPIIMAGGPGSYNPEPLSDFIDIFLVGDGENVLLELLNELENLNKKNISRVEKLKALLHIEGVYIPQFYSVENDFSRPTPNIPEAPAIINKRISQLKEEDYPVNFPVPFSPSVHDRAVVEIRRGCGRMCRFCQPCFVNLPIRERETESIVNLVDKNLKNTGYQEYSLLSLSSNDYNNIEGLVCKLNQDHAPSGASISLPSQRADSFSVQLAEQVQSVRKSTLTFAPEAGSQKLRDVINKNLTKEQIFDAIFSAYKAGWGKAKLYFMIGLPTETFDDLDEIINLLKEIKYKSKDIKREHNLNHHLDLNCTVSIFVPKPFTPFQWCAQDSIELINEKIRFLRDKIRRVKGVKLSIHDSFLCQLEAVFTRGDRRLNSVIEKAWELGSYLDAWNEHFNKSLWHEAASQLEINFEDYSSNRINIDNDLPWNFINIGVNPTWLKNEYNNALNQALTSPCDEGCTNCGVCSNFKTKKEIKSNDNNLEVDSVKSHFIIQSDELHKYRLKAQKTNHLRFISHLDWLGLIHKAVRKAGLNVAFTQGFNPKPKISVGVALPLFVESNCEYIDIELYDNLKDDELFTLLNQNLPLDSKISKIVKISKEVKSIDKLVEWAKYVAIPVDNETIKGINLNHKVLDFLNQEEVFIEKTNKKGIKNKINIRPSIKNIEIINKDGIESLEFILSAGQRNPAIRPLRADDFIKILTPDFKWKIIRTKILDSNLKELL